MRNYTEAEKNGRHYVVELKVAEGKEAADKVMKQIRKGYANKYASVGATLVAMAVDRERRRVGGCRVEKL